MEKKRFVDTLREGEPLDDLFLVKSVVLNRTRAGKPYLVLTVMDKSGEISGPVWDGVEQVKKVCEVGAFVRISGSVQSYRDKPQLRLDQVWSVARDQVDSADFVVSCQGNLEEMARQIQMIVDGVDNRFLKQLLTILLLQKEIWKLFREAPAAKTMHHGYLGGLLEHSLSVAQLANLVAAHYPGVDRSLLVTGALLHDIGKIKELSMDMGLIAYTDIGRMKGHLVMGSEMVANGAARIDGFPPELLQQVQHLILSHHGQLQFGSPTLPMTVEALLLSQIDDMDAKMNMMEQLRRKMDGSDFQWTDYQRSLERYLFLRPLTEANEAPEPAVDPSVARQPSLF